MVGSLLAGGGAAVVAVWAPSNTLEMTNHELLHDVILQWRAMYLLGVAIIGLILCAVPFRLPIFALCSGSAWWELLVMNSGVGISAHKITPRFQQVCVCAPVA